jgi:hypothetical protein
VEVEVEVVLMFERTTFTTHKPVHHSIRDKFLDPATTLITF